MAAEVSRTELVEDPVLVAKLDAAIARHAPKWMRLSEPKLFERIDMWVMRFDPAGSRVPGERIEDRYVDIAPTDSGLAGVWAQLHATDGAAMNQKLVKRLPTRSARQIRGSRNSVVRPRWALWSRDWRRCVAMRVAGLSGSTTTSGRRRGGACLG